MNVFRLVVCYSTVVLQNIMLDIRLNRRKKMLLKSNVELIVCVVLSSVFEINQLKIEAELISIRDKFVQYQ